MTFKAGDRVKCINAQSASGLRLGEIYTVSRIDRYGSLDLLRLDERHELKGYFATRFELAGATTHQPFKVGDRVRCIVRDYKVERGEVLTVAKLSQPNEVILSNGVGYFASHFELAEDETAPSPKTSRPPNFKVGDLVRCLDAGGYEHFGFRDGGLYTVTKVLPGVRAPTMLSFVELMKVSGTMFASRFEFVSRADAVFEKTLDKVVKAVGPAIMNQTFKPGDRLRLIDSTRLAAEPGSIAVVQDPVCDLGRPYVTKDMVNVKWEPHVDKDGSLGKQKDGHYYPGVFELVETAKPIMNQTYKPGQRVRCVDTSQSNDYLKKGQIYTIRAVRECTAVGRGEPSNLVFDLEEIPKYQTGWMASRFQLVETASVPARRGEAVRRVLEEEARRLNSFTVPFSRTLDEEYGPAPEKPNPLWNAINKRWSSHPSDAVIHLDELRKP